MMVSDEWENSDWKTEEEFDYIEAYLTSSEWWNDLKRVLDTVQPYSVLRYPDQQKDVTVSGFKARMMTAVQELTAQLGEDTYEFENYMSKVGPRIKHMYDDTLMLAGTPFVLKLLVDEYVALVLHLSCSFCSNMYSLFCICSCCP